MKRLVSFAGLLVVAACSDSSIPAGLAPESAVLGSTTMSAKAGVTVCHITGNGKYNLLTIAGAAQPAHLAHGDGLPGQGFTSDCLKETIPINIDPSDIDWSHGTFSFKTYASAPTDGWVVLDSSGNVMQGATVTVGHDVDPKGTFTPCTSFSVVVRIGSTTIGSSGLQTVPSGCVPAP